jgi:hypothetical protein
VASSTTTALVRTSIDQAVAVEVEEAARVHEAVVLSAIRLGATRRERSGSDRIDLLTG